jgi:hypothetical protein
MLDLESRVCSSLDQRHGMSTCEGNVVAMEEERVVKGR